MTPAGARRASPIRYIAGVVCIVVALVVLPGGCVQLVRTLNAGGYGTTAITYALGWLSFGGGLLSVGIALLIWELSIRHNIRH